MNQNETFEFAWIEIVKTVGNHVIRGKGTRVVSMEPLEVVDFEMEFAYFGDDWNKIQDGMLAKETLRVRSHVPVGTPENTFKQGVAFGEVIRD